VPQWDSGSADAGNVSARRRQGRPFSRHSPEDLFIVMPRHCSYTRYQSHNEDNWRRVTQLFLKLRMSRGRLRVPRVNDFTLRWLHSFIRIHLSTDARVNSGWICLRLANELRQTTAAVRNSYRMTSTITRNLSLLLSITLINILKQRIRIFLPEDGRTTETCSR
jgi:hypothetical protein